MYFEELYFPPAMFIGFKDDLITFYLNQPLQNVQMAEDFYPEGGEGHEHWPYGNFVMLTAT